MAKKIQHYTVCTKCGVEQGILALITPCKHGSHLFTGQRTRWVED